MGNENESPNNRVDVMAGLKDMSNDVRGELEVVESCLDSWRVFLQGRR